MPNHSHEPCPIEVPEHWWPHAMVRINGKAVCRVRDFSVWLTPEALTSLASREYVRGQCKEDRIAANEWIQRAIRNGA